MINKKNKFLFFYFFLIRLFITTAPLSDTKKTHKIHLMWIVSESHTQMMFSAIVCGTILLAIIGYLFTRQIPFVLRITPTKYLARTLMLCGVYSIIGTAALTSLIAYPAALFCDSICHFTFTVGAYQFFALCIEYVGGETNFIKRTGGLMAFNPQTPPLCCCLNFLEPMLITKLVYFSLNL